MTLILIDCENFAAKNLHAVFSQYKVDKNTKAYGFCDFRLQSNYTHEVFAEYNIIPFQVFHSKGKKNAADLVLARVAYEHIFTGKISTLVIASSDSDFSDLMLCAKAHDIEVICFASNIQHNQILKSACSILHEATEEAITTNEQISKAIELYKNSKMQHKHLSANFIKLLADNDLLDASHSRQSINAHLKAMGFVLKKTASNNRIFLPGELEENGAIKPEILAFLNNIRAQEHKLLIQKADEIYAMTQSLHQQDSKKLIEIFKEQNILETAFNFNTCVSKLKALGFHFDNQNQICEKNLLSKSEQSSTETEDLQLSEDEQQALAGVIFAYKNNYIKDEKFLEENLQEFLQEICSKNISINSLKNLGILDANLHIQNVDLKPLAFKILSIYKAQFFEHFGCMAYFLALLSRRFGIFSQTGLIRYLFCLDFSIKSYLVFPPTHTGKSLKKHLIIGKLASINAEITAEDLVKTAKDLTLLPADLSLIKCYEIFQQIGIKFERKNCRMIAKSPDNLQEIDEKFNSYVRLKKLTYEPAKLSIIDVYKQKILLKNSKATKAK